MPGCLQCDTLDSMNGKRTEASTNSLLVINDNKTIVEELPAVPVAETGARITELLARHGQDIRILINGAPMDAQAMIRAQVVAPRVPSKPPFEVLADNEEGPVLSVELAHTMLWDTYDRAARVQSWMLEQASAFTLDLLNNNKRLADQAGELQKRYQTSLAEIDYMAREQKLMEGEAAAARLSRHLIEKARAEIAAANPSKSAEWIDDLIDGAAVALGAICGPRGPKDSN